MTSTTSLRLSATLEKLYAPPVAVCEVLNEPFTYMRTVLLATAVPDTVKLPLYNVVCVMTGVVVAVRLTQEPHIGADSHLPVSVTVK